MSGAGPEPAIVLADPDDPRVAALAEDLAGHLPAELVAAAAGSLADPESRQWLETVTRELSAAQVEVLRLLMTIMEERA